MYKSTTQVDNHENHNDYNHKHCAQCATLKAQNTTRVSQLDNLSENEQEHEHQGHSDLNDTDSEPHHSQIGHNYVEVHQHEDADHPHNKIELWKLILGLGLFFLILAMHIAKWSGANGDDFYKATAIVMTVSATIVMITIGVGYIEGSIDNIKNKELGEDTLVAMSSTFAYLGSMIMLIIWIFGGFSDTGFAPTKDGRPPALFFDATIDVAVIIYIGRYIESKLSSEASKDIDALVKLFAKTANVLSGEKEIQVKIDNLKIGDIVVVRNNETIPTDGVIVQGTTFINESVFTGEPMATGKNIDDHVFAGTVIESGMIRIKVTTLQKDSMLGKVIKGVTSAQSARPEAQKLADKIATFLIPVVFSIAILLLIIVGTTIGPMYGFIIFITVMVIACPCSFAMTTPLSILVAGGVGTKNGVIYSSKEIFEKVKKIDAIAFDKTGTITVGELEIEDNTIPKKYWSAIKTAENNSSHPIAKSIYKNLAVKEIKNDIKIKETIGLGLKITFKEEILMFGSLKYVQTIIPAYKATKEIIEGQNYSKQFIFLFNNKKVLGYISLVDTIKEGAKESIQQLQKDGIEVYLITGDIKAAAYHVGEAVGIKTNNIFFGVDPAEKHKIIKEIQDRRLTVCFVGDGVNDAIALTQSDIGIAMGKGTDAAIEASDIVVNDSSLATVYNAIQLSKKTLYVIKRGFTMAIIYNIIAVSAIAIIPAVIMEILGIHMLWLPMVGAFAMFLNDTLAIFNALTLKTYRFKKDKKFTKKTKENI